MRTSTGWSRRSAAAATKSSLLRSIRQHTINAFEIPMNNRPSWAATSYIVVKLPHEPTYLSDLPSCLNDSLDFEPANKPTGDPETPSLKIHLVHRVMFTGHFTGASAFVGVYPG